MLELAKDYPNIDDEIFYKRLDQAKNQCTNRFFAGYVDCMINTLNTGSLIAELLEINTWIGLEPWNKK